MTITAYDVASRFVGLTEVSGPVSNPAVLAMLRLDDASAQDDAIPWCSAFVNYVAWLLRLPRSKSLAARSWLAVGRVIDLHEAIVGFDVVILNRGASPQPGPEVLDAPGHVGFFAGWRPGDDGTSVVMILGGNQSDAVSIGSFSATRVLGVRRLYEENA
jgi:uncharacterized protein (TIGR02594 family)